MPEIGYNDGSYLTQKGNDLIAKLMASRGGLQFTRVSVGDGSIPSGSSRRLLCARSLLPGGRLGRHHDHLHGLHRVSNYLRRQEPRRET